MFLFAARGRALRRLLEGDPVAWGILAAVVVVSIAIWFVKKRWGSGD